MHQYLGGTAVLRNINNLANQKGVIMNTLFTTASSLRTLCNGIGADERIFSNESGRQDYGRAGLGLSRSCAEQVVQSSSN
ncbi:predicted protein [Sclerotinia sclerotiorum 1980 UF-70]|uniref:Uncharacterized protein n=1 Tax=Sclerotinia sclerotiorum (strain ATCC 18683 / 1980 / Ss-1) TaxID=665079 RepID=A7ES93_SCLS1|nr:predicted protein [Sclerotinia sclerotiorum 1980 UF-70]EDN92335.1 predicted protein [Sclerotinia sclerotiorum 1980 UF-70]